MLKYEKDEAMMKEDKQQHQNQGKRRKRRWLGGEEVDGKAIAESNTANTAKTARCTAGQSVAVGRSAPLPAPAASVSWLAHRTLLDSRGEARERWERWPAPAVWVPPMLLLRSL